LDGSVEIAPLLGLADAIVDLVETGRTLKENGMAVIEEIAHISAKLIVNRTAMKMKANATNELITALDAVVYEDS
jgi:ATP phosphoribosyltransferase